MLVDHIGLLFFPEQPLWRLIGRIAFPLYAYAIVAGLHYTSNRKRYLRRLAVLAAVSQIPYMLAFDVYQVNVIGSLLVAAAALLLMERYSSLPTALFIAAGAAIALELLAFSYGGYAMLLAVIYRYLRNAPMIAAHLGLNAVYGLYTGWTIQHASIVPTVLLALAPAVFDRYRTTFVPRWLWLSFYPAHLAILYALDMRIGGG